MSAPDPKSVEAFDALEPSCRDTAASALTVVRDGVITGEGPTTKGRVHFSRCLDAADVVLCARILTASAVEHQPISRAEVEALFEIDDAATERSDDGRFDDLLAKALAHHAAAASGLHVPPRTVALSPDTENESWAPIHAAARQWVLRRNWPSIVKSVASNFPQRSKGATCCAWAARCWSDCPPGPTRRERRLCEPLRDVTTTR